MKEIKFDQCREVLTSGDVVNCVKKPIMMWAKQMHEDFTVETLEHQVAPYKGSAGDYLMISPSCEMYVCSKEFFEANYEINTFFEISQFAEKTEDYYDGIGFWRNSPFTDEAIEILRNKKLK